MSTDHRDRKGIESPVKKMTYVEKWVT